MILHFYDPTIILRKGENDSMKNFSIRKCKAFLENHFTKFISVNRKYNSDKTGKKFWKESDLIGKFHM